MPRQKLRIRQTLPALRLNQPGAVVGEQLRLGVVAAHQVAAEHDLVVPRQHGERAEVENLVVQRARGRPARPAIQVDALELLDVRAFEADRVDPALAG